MRNCNKHVYSTSVLVKSRSGSYHTFKIVISQLSFIGPRLCQRDIWIQIFLFLSAILSFCLFIWWSIHLSVIWFSQDWLITFFWSGGIYFLRIFFCPIKGQWVFSGPESVFSNFSSSLHFGFFQICTFCHIKKWVKVTLLLWPK